VGAEAELRHEAEEASCFEQSPIGDRGVHPAATQTTASKVPLDSCAFSAYKARAGHSARWHSTAEAFSGGGSPVSART
jgi:hypothetical protein